MPIISTEVDESFNQMLDERAKVEDRSKSSLLRYLINKGLEAEKNENKTL